MEEISSIQDLAAALGISRQAAQKTANKENWPREKRREKGGGYVYPVDTLPDAVRDRVETYLQEQRKTTQAEAARAQAQSVFLSPAAAAGAEFGRKLREDQARSEAERRQALERGLAAWERLPPKKRAVAEARHAVLEACRAYLIHGGYNAGATWSKRACNAFLDDLRLGKLGRSDALPLAVAGATEGLCYVTLTRWRRAFEAEGLYGLAPGHTAHNRGTSTVTPVMAEHLEGAIYRHPQIQLKKLALLLEARFGRELAPHEASVRRWVKRWRDENRSLWLFLTNPDQWKQRHLASTGDASAPVERLNQRWELDSTPADLLFQGADGRYTLLACVEVYSRNALIVVAPTSKAAAVAALIRKALLAWGAPEEAVTDNGQDYVAQHIVQVFGALEIEQILCPPFSPEKKPHVESFFKTFLHDLVELMPGFIGHSVAERKGIEARRTFAQRMFERDSTVELRCTPEEFAAFCERWLGVYRKRPHGGLSGKSPADVQRAWPAQPNFRPVPRITNERALDVLLMEAPKDGGWRTVQKQKIQVKPGRYSNAEGLLAPHEGKQVYAKLDPTDLSRICVYALNQATGLKDFVCWAVDPSLPGVDRAEHAAKVRHHERAYFQGEKKELKAKAKKHGLETALAEELLAAEEARYANVLEMPRPSGPEYTTPALEEAARAVEDLVAGADRAAAEDASADPLGDIIFAEERATEARRAQIHEVFSNPVDMYNAYCRRYRQGSLTEAEIARFRAVFAAAELGEQRSIKQLHRMGLGGPEALAVWL